VDARDRGGPRRLPGVEARRLAGAGLVRQADHRPDHRRAGLLAALPAIPRAVSGGLLAAAAILLLAERACYVWIAPAPRSFQRWSGRSRVARLGGPVAVVRALFVAFKVLQAAVFAAWILAHGDGRLLPPEPDPAVLLVGGVAVLVGQV